MNGGNAPEYQTRNQFATEKKPKKMVSIETQLSSIMTEIMIEIFNCYKYRMNL
jgi:hypothetical protein